MRARLVVFLIIGVSCVFGLIFARQVWLSKGLDRQPFMEKKVRVLTYSTFVAATGPGPELIKRFQETCNCKVDVTAVSDAGLLLERLKIGGGGAHFDVVIGLDQLMLEQAKTQFVWRELESEGFAWHPDIKPYAQTAEFLPIDWSPLSFVYKDDGRPVPKAFKELLDSKYRKHFLLEDPRASSPGLQFLNWVNAIAGDQASAFLKSFKDNVQSVSPSWAFAYGQFKKSQGRFVFSYLTSLAFHWGSENDRSYKILNFPEGHPVQVEYAAVPAQCQQCELGVQFVEAMLSEEGQKTIMLRNFMLPVRKDAETGSIYGELPKLKIIATDSRKDLRDWDQVFSH